MDAQTRAALEYVVADRDAAQAKADNRALYVGLRDTARVEAQAYNLVLATFAGTLGYVERRYLELDLATSLAQLGRITKADAISAALAGPDDDEDDDEDEPADPEADRLGRQALATILDAEYPAIPADPSEPWDPADAVSAAYTQAELDTQDEPMGGWEPRS